MNSILILIFVGGGVLYRNGGGGDEGLSRMVLRIGIFNHRKKRKGEKDIFVRTTVNTYLQIYYRRILLLFKGHSYT